MTFASSGMEYSVLQKCGSGSSNNATLLPGKLIPVKVIAGGLDCFRIVKIHLNFRGPKSIWATMKVEDGSSTNSRNYRVKIGGFVGR
jgi:hypothetical protein